MEKIVLGLDEIENTIKVSTDFIKSYYTHTHMYNEMLVYEPFEGYVTVNNEKIQIKFHNTANRYNNRFSQYNRNG